MFIKEAGKVKAMTVIKNLEKRNMEGYYCDSSEEAADKVMSMIHDSDTVAWGGSVTLDQIGIKKLLKDNNIAVYDRDTVTDPAEKKKMMKKALIADVYLTSANAITMDGEILNIDGNGNRVAAYCYGPESLIVVAGVNKIVTDLDEAFKRARLDAAVPNVIRLGLKTPCSLTGKCSECLTNSTICGQILVTRFAKPKNRIKVVLVGDHLGF